MPFGQPFSDETRKARHSREYGNLETFPEKRLGYGDGKLAYNRAKLSEDYMPLVYVGAGLVILYLLLKKK